MTDEVDPVEAAKRAVEEAQAALAKAQADAATAETIPLPEALEGNTLPPAPLNPAAVATIKAGYAFDGSVLEIGALVNGDGRPYLHK